MKRILIFVTVLSMLSACKKESTDNPPAPQPYVNTTSGSSWSYHAVNSSTGTPSSADYTITSTTSDTTINGKSYHVYSYSYGGSQYLNQTNGDYYEYDSIPGGIGQAVERLYLKDNINKGGTWDQSLSVKIEGFPLGNVPVKISNKIMDKGIERTVSGVTYKDVIHVQTTLSSSMVPASGLTSDIHSYFAPGYGLIENSTNVDLDYLGITQKVQMTTTLISANLK